MKKRTFAIPILGATGICLATACASPEALVGSWELTSLTDGEVVLELPRLTETEGNSYEQFGSLTMDETLNGALVLLTYVNSAQTTGSDFKSSIVEGMVGEDKRTYTLDARGSFRMTVDCEVTDDAGEEELTCSGEQFNLQNISFTGRRFDDE